MKKFDYIKSTKDGLYLKVNNLLEELILQAMTNSPVNLEAYSYLYTINNQITLDSSIEQIKKTEGYLLESNFLDNKCFTNLEREKMKRIIREYKLNNLDI